MNIKMYQIDAFTQQVFSGNPAAVCVLEGWLSDEVMQKIAAENNLAETAFVIKSKKQFQIRWFTPTVEVDLCGHATLASAYVLFNYYEPDLEKIPFYSNRSGELTVSRSKTGEMTMNFPADELKELEIEDRWINSLGIMPQRVLKGKTDYLLIYPNQEAISKIVPNFHELNKVECRGVIVSSQGDEVDFVSRFFAPQVGVDEDPVTGSAHTTLIPFWTKELFKTKMRARQVSSREGDLGCESLGKRVEISGFAVLYLIGEIRI